MNETDLNTALEIFRFLLDHKGKMLNIDDPQLYDSFQNQEIRDILRDFESVFDVHFLNVNHAIYLIPGMHNKTFGYSWREYREDISSSTRTIDAYTIAYIQMYVCYEFYGSKNTADPRQRDFIRIQQLTEDINHLFDNLSKEVPSLSEIDSSHEMNFESVIENWNNKITRDNSSRTTKEGIVRTALTQFVNHGLLTVTDDEYRPTQEFEDKFIHYYLNEDRVQEINEIFEEHTGGKDNAANQ